MKRRYSRRRRLKLALLLTAAVIGLIAAYQGGRWLEKQSEQPETRGTLSHRFDAEENTLTVDGVVYHPRKNLTTLLLMGVDQSTGTAGGGYRNGGQADFLRLVVIDHEEQRVSQLEIDRDTMTPIAILGVLGNRSGMRTAQISLSHGFGDGGAQSCELTVEAVSNLLYQTPIELYAAMNLDGIPALNDLVGGVTVHLEEDFSQADPIMMQGSTLTLNGRQAEIYVRSRMGIGSGTNTERMTRQRQYIANLISRLDEYQREDQNFGGRMFDALEPYLTTNFSRGRLINEMWRARAYTRSAPLNPAGVHQTGKDGFMQFLVDEKSLQQAVLELLYEP